MNLSGHTRPYAVLGHPIGHTLSPVMHNASFRSLGLDAIYLAFDVAPDRLAAVLPAMAAMGFGGVNLTVPLKETAFRLLDDLDESARMTGSVNTVEFTERGLRGHSTDGPGFLLALQEAFHCGPCGDTVFVLGCGGAGRAVAMACAGAGAARLRLADADATRAQALAEDMAAWSPQTDVQALSAASEVWAQASHLSDLVVQATPAGMKPGDRSPLAAAAFRDGQRVFDLIYMQPETPWRSFTIWTGDMPDLGAMRHALETSVYGKQDTSEPL